MSKSVVVVCCQSHRWLAPCINSVLEQADEVVVVDNGSPGQWATQEARRLGARTVTLDRNAGFPAGVNAGLEVATGEIVALLNDDAMAEENWLEQSEAVLSDSTVAAVAPKLLLAWPHLEVTFDDEPWFSGDDPRPLGRALQSVTVAGEEVLAAVIGPGVHELETGYDDGRLVQWRWTRGREPLYVPLPDGAGPDDVVIEGEPPPSGRVVDLVNNAGSYLSREGHGGDYGFETPDGPTFDEPADRFAACGGAMAVRKETFRRLGGFAESFFAYYEDTDWCWRAQLAGLRIRYDPRGAVRHVRSVSTSANPRIASLAARNRFLCLARNAPLGILRWQVRRTSEPGTSPDLRRSLARRLPRALVERRILARHWTRTPAEVFASWAGRDETWPR